MAYFPLDVAYEDAFFNRDSERKRLRYNIDSNTHTLITSPRRYGKTSLVLKTLDEAEVAYCNIDMLLATDSKRMQTVIMDGINQIASQLISGKKKWLQLAKSIFQPFSTIESIELDKVKLKFYPHMEKAPHLIIYDALTRLEKLASDINSKAVLFLDEYQHVLSIKDSLDFEASLRSFAQTAKHIVCIFSGSNRHMLQAMFNDSSRPFYNMCDHLLLGRILAKDYHFYLAKVSKERWQKALDADLIDLILELTARHTYFVNALCRLIWQNDDYPNSDTIMALWYQLSLEKRYELNSDFDKLSPIQRSILIELSVQPFSKPTSKDVVARLNASLTGITHALDGLIEKDYVYQEQDTNNYRVLNPLMEYILRKEVQRLQ